MWIVPSRGRPHNCRRLFAAEWNSPGVLCVDDDDPLLDQYRALTLPANWRLAIGRRTPLSEIYNRHFGSAAWHGIGADDMLPETLGWDLALIAAAGSDGLAFGDDGINGDRHATHFVLGDGLAREVGWLALPGLSRIFIDTVWNEIAEARGVRRYLPDVKLTHLHFSIGAPRDETYRKPDKASDRAIYDQWRKAYDTPRPARPDSA